MVDDQSCADSLTTLAGAAAARHDGHAQVAANLQRQRDVCAAARHKDTGRYALVDRGVGGVAAFVGGGKQDLALGFARQPCCQSPGDFVATLGHLVVGVVVVLVSSGLPGDVRGQRGVHACSPSPASRLLCACTNCAITTSRLLFKWRSSTARMAAGLR